MGSAPTHRNIARVFAAWQTSTGRTRTRLDKPRRALIRRALADYPVEDVLAAVDGWRHSPHHRGENDRHTVYNDLSLLLRNGEHIERFRDYTLGHLTTQPRLSPSEVRARIARGEDEP